MTDPQPTEQQPADGTTVDPAQEVAALAARVMVTNRERVTANALPLWNSTRPWWWLIWAALGIVLAWATMLALASVALLRIFYHDGTYLLVSLNAFTWYLYLPAYGVLAWAAWNRRWPLAAVSSLVVACHLAWTVPDFIPLARATGPPAASTAARPAIRVFFANVLATNNQFQALLDEIDEAKPDVVILVEYTPPWHQALSISPVMAPYVYRPKGMPLGRVGWYSRVPVVDYRGEYVAGRYNLFLTIRAGTDLVRLFSLHSPRPMDVPQHDYAGYWARTLPSLAEQPRPLIVIGDFNATQHSRVYEELSSIAGLHSAHEDRGRGYATTWPNGAYPLPPIRIDQVFLSPQVQCLGIAEGRGRGSDHKPLILDARVLPHGPAAD